MFTIISKKNIKYVIGPDLRKYNEIFVVIRSTAQTSLIWKLFKIFFYLSQPNDLNTGFLNETGVSSSNFNTTMGSSVVEQSDVGLPSNLAGGGCDEKSSKEARKYIHTRQLGKMRDEIGAVECFKTRADDPKSINTLMERTLAVGLNSHLKRRKAELKKQTSYEPKSIEDLSPFGDHGSKVSRRLKTLEISAQKVVETEELDVRVVGLAGLDEDDDDCVRAVPVLSGVCDSNNSKAEEEGEDRIKMIDESLERSGNVGGAACEDVGKKSTATEDKGCQTEPLEMGKLIKKKSFPLCCFDKTRSETMTSISKFLNKH